MSEGKARCEVQMDKVPTRELLLDVATFNRLYSTIDRISDEAVDLLIPAVSQVLEGSRIGARRAVVRLCIEAMKIGSDP